MRPLEPEDPQAIGGYRLLGRLGEGGMGQVYLARSQRGRTVAVKTIQPALARERAFRERFAQEIATARRVGGEWTAPVLDADTEGRVPWVATGYIAGPTLHRVVAEDYGPLPERSLTFLARGLVLALRDIHTTGLVHRDLKPSNVMITIEGPRVIDFGIARALDAVTSGGLTRTGAVIGSPGFMSPEQVRGARLTTASDIFCLGAVLAYAATGRLPFGTADSGGHALMFRIVEEDPALDGIPDALLGLVGDCLDKDPERRPGIPELLERTGTAAEAEPWLPAEVLAQLGRHAVALLDSEDPAAAAGPPAPPTAPPRPGGAPAHITAGAPTAHPLTYTAPAYAPGAAPVRTPPPAHAPGAHTPPPWRTPPPPGHAWPAPGPAVPQGPPPEPRRASALANALTWLFAVMALLVVVTLVVHLQLLGDLREERKADPYLLFSSVADAAEGSKTTLDVLTTLVGLLQIAIFVVWLIWFRRMRCNAEAFAPGRIRYRPNRAVIFWFVPFANLALPKQIADDIWRASHPLPHPAVGLVNTWWTLLLGWIVYGIVVSGDPWHEADDWDEAVTRGNLGAVEQVLCLAAALAAVVFLRRLTTMQHNRLTGPR
ncbi:DUF4328 domain-containing protein [Streptomyces sp. MP131-18]|uniref:protein kinase domain-containing protein n=1 Tax=Streptomyces sp. MP131-18 TaxID=1857892 RepID=UPI00097C08FF|nr:DUF4328 domain-containing protein [Streptomyces sp. MP131-18]ONK12526.1 Serine/threonine-protein kinase AfsK [Streptomyces sp. MP131-18]